MRWALINLSFSPLALFVLVLIIQLQDGHFSQPFFFLVFAFTLVKRIKPTISIIISHQQPKLQIIKMTPVEKTDDHQTVNEQTAKQQSSDKLRLIEQLTDGTNVDGQTDNHQPIDRTDERLSSDIHRSINEQTAKTIHDDGQADVTRIDNHTDTTVIEQRSDISIGDDQTVGETDIGQTNGKKLNGHSVKTIDDGRADETDIERRSDGHSNGTNVDGHTGKSSDSGQTNGTDIHGHTDNADGGWYFAM